MLCLDTNKESFKLTFQHKQESSGFQRKEQNYIPSFVLLFAVFLATKQCTTRERERELPERISERMSECVSSKGKRRSDCDTKQQHQDEEAD